MATRAKTKKKSGKVQKRKTAGSSKEKKSTSSRSGRSKDRILWALTPFEKFGKQRDALIRTLSHVGADTSAQIEPVTVLSPDDLEWGTQGNFLKVSDFKDPVPVTKKAVRTLLKDVQVSGMADPKIIVAERPSLTYAVWTLLKHAKNVKAKMIVLNSHGRTGVSRAFLGSFAETLMLYSTIPVLVVGPAIKSTRAKHILFATDFGPASAKLYPEIIRLAQQGKARITLFHAIPHWMEPVFQSGVYLLGGGWFPWPQTRVADKEQERIKKMAQKWVDQAAKQKVRAELVLDVDSQSVTESILNRASDQKISLIAMAAESGPVAATLMGSVTREVVRRAPCPVWVMRK